MSRGVFYITGYDPKSYRFYYDLFKKNLKDYSHRFDLKAGLNGIEKNENFPLFKINCENTQIRCHFLAWDDIARKNWSQSYKDALMDCYSFSRIYTITRPFLKFGKESIYQLITGYYPPFYIIFSLLLPLGSVLGSFVFLQDHTPSFLVIVIGIILEFLLNRFLSRLGRKLAVFWIARTCAFYAAWKEKRLGTMEQRIKLFADETLKPLKQNENG